jgi:hypothetical protein
VSPCRLLQTLCMTHQTVQRLLGKKPKPDNQTYSDNGMAHLVTFIHSDIQRLIAWSL